MSRFGAVLAMLHAAHDLADHVVQTEHQAIHKADPGRAGWLALAGHVGSYTAVQVAALALLRGGFAPGRLVAGVVFSAATHALLDRRWPVRWILEHTGHDGWARPPVIGGDWTAVGRAPGASGGDLVARTLAVRTPVTAVPLHGPYLSDQALHHACLAISALIITSPGEGP